MSSNESETQQEKKPEGPGASPAACCQPCMPGRAFAFKRMAEQCAERTDEQTKPAPCDFGPRRASGCCGEGSGK